MRKIAWIIPGLLLSGSIGLTGVSRALSPVNTVNDGRIIQGGSYYNTADAKTTFKNSGPGGLWLKGGTTLRGLEVNNNGDLTNNGGTVQLYAPGNVVRIDGDINVNGILNNRGDYLGNGGKVFIDSAYLYQNGNIFANGGSGGLVQANVGGMTMGSNAIIEAKGGYTNPSSGIHGAGGVVSINSKGPVDTRLGAYIETTGRTLPTLDTNIMNVEGSVINLHGRLIANGVDSRGGTIRLVTTGQTDLSSVNQAIDNASSAAVGPDPTITSAEATRVKARLEHLSQPVFDGDVQLSASASRILANGNINIFSTGQGNDLIENPVRRAGDGGTVIISAAEDVVNYGIVQANGERGSLRESEFPAGFGGNGGTIAITAQGGFADPAQPNSSGRIVNTGLVVADGGGGGPNRTFTPGLIGIGGKGGEGGMIALAYKDIHINAGRIQANGGEGGIGDIGGSGAKGGLIVFSGSNNPTGNGIVLANGGPGGAEADRLSRMGLPGTIVTPNPASATTGQVFRQLGQVNGVLVNNPLSEQTQTNELLSHAENLVLLTRNGGNGPAPAGLFDRMLSSRKRSLKDPTGMLGRAQEEIIIKNTDNPVYTFRNLLISSTRNNLELDMTHPYQKNGFSVELLLPSPLSLGQAFINLNTLTVSNAATVVTSSATVGSEGGILYTGFLHLGSHLTGISPQGGAHLSILAKGDLLNKDILGSSGLWSGGSVNLSSTGTFRNGDTVNLGMIRTGESRFPGVYHGGSIMIKAGGDLLNMGNSWFESKNIISADGNLMGGTIQLQAGRDLLNHIDSHAIPFQGSFISANVLPSFGNTHTVQQAGIIDGFAGRNILNGSPVSGPLGPDESGAAQFSANAFFSGRGGFIRLIAGSSFHNGGLIQASGPQGNGTIITSP